MVKHTTTAAHGKKEVRGNSPAKGKHTEEQALAKTGTTALSTELDFGEDYGQGFENQTSADKKLPILEVLQAKSPLVEDPEKNPEDKFKAGMFHNTATDEVYSGKTGIVIVPAITEHLYIEWVPRDKGGGFVAAHPLGSEVANFCSGKFGRVALANGNEVQETFQIFAVVCEDNDDSAPIGPVVIPFVSKKINTYKGLSTRLSQFQVPVVINGETRKVTPPLFSHRIRLTTVFEQNPKGPAYNISADSFKGSMLDSLIGKSHPAYQMAKKLRDDYMAGLVKVQTPTDEPAGDPTNAGHF